MSELEATDRVAHDAGGATAGSSTRSSDRSGSTRALRVALLVGLVALIPRLLTVGHFFNLDEWLWMNRSMRFSDALLSGQLEHMSATKPLVGTMPGITTVWLGSLARGVWNIGVKIGLVDGGQEFVNSASGFTTGQAMMAVTTAVLIGLFTWLVAKWMSARVALLAGILLATEPFWVSLGSILHTDELVALCGLAGLVALSWTLGLPGGVTAPEHPRRWAIVAVVLLLLAALTKVSGLVFGVPAMGMMGWALLRALRNRPPDVSAVRACEPILRLGAWMLLAAVVTIVVTYPALIFDTANQWDALQGQFKTARTDRSVFFMGEVQAPSAIEFYPITLAYHSSVWFFLLAPVGVAVALVRRVSRPFAVTVLAWAVVPGLSLLNSGLVYARYGLVILGPVALAAASALQPDAPIRRWWKDRLDQGVVAIAGAAFIWAVLVAPWGGLTFNPILSAYREPVLVMSVSWGEAPAAAMEVIERDAHAQGRSCNEIRVQGLGRNLSPTDCKPLKTRDSSEADYIAISTARVQRFGRSHEGLRDDFELIEVVHLRGQRLTEVWRRK